MEGFLLPEDQQKVHEQFDEQQNSVGRKGKGRFLLSFFLHLVFFKVSDNLTSRVKGLHFLILELSTVLKYS